VALVAGWIPFTRWTVRRLQLGQPPRDTPGQEVRAYTELPRLVTRVHWGWMLDGLGFLAGGQHQWRRPQIVAQRFELRSNWASSKVTSSLHDDT
jgi:hypothetical protein